jgi:glycerophosphoryl diester phosphodiesterase
LEELLQFAKKKINLYLDCKEVNPETLVQAIRAAQMEDQVVVFASNKMLGRINQSGLGTIPLFLCMDSTTSIDSSGNSVLQP